MTCLTLFAKLTSGSRQRVRHLGLHILARKSHPFAPSTRRLEEFGSPSSSYERFFTTPPFHSPRELVY